jgi:hypothetical protein
MPMYARGDVAWGLCQRCGLRYYLHELVFDGYYPNLRVCNGCYDPPQPQERLAIVTDPVALYKPAVDTMYVSPPVLTLEQVGDEVILNWSGFNQISGDLGTESVDDYGPGQGKSPVGSSSGANITSGYYVNRSPDGINWSVIAMLPNTADDFGAFVVEVNTYTDSPGVGTWYYSVTGFDVLAHAEYG